MYEWRRVVLNKKMIVSMILLLMLTLGLYVRTQLLSTSFYGGVKEYTSQYQSLSHTVELWEQDEVLEWEEGVDEQETQIKFMLLHRWNYIQSYPQKIETILQQEQTINQIGIFNKKNSTSEKNVHKTSQEYKKLEGMELSIGQDEFITSVIQYKEVHYSILLVVFLFVFRVFSERKRGLWPMVHTTAKGRGKLAVKRTLILWSTVTAMIVLLYSGIIVTSMSMYGASTLNRPIQSIEMFQDFVYPMSEAQFLLLYILVTVLAYSAILAIVWAICSVFANRTIAILAIGLTFGIGYFFHTGLQEQSNVVLLRYINLFHFVDMSEIFTSYRNLSLLGGMWNKFEFSILLTAVLFVIGMAAGIYINHRAKPFQKVSLIEQKIMELGNQLRRVTERWNVIGLEIYKVVWVQKGWIILAAVIYLGVTSGSIKTISYSEQEAYYNKFCREYGGVLSQEAMDELEVMEQGMEEDIVLYIKERVEYVQAVQDSGKEGYIFNDLGYTMLLGEKTFQKQETTAITAVFTLILLLAGMFGYEKKSGIEYSLRCAKYGRRNLYRKKLVVVALITAIVTLFTYGIEVYYIYETYGLGAYEANIANARFLNEMDLNITLGQLLALVYTLRFVLLGSIACIVVAISTYFTTEITVLVASGALLLAAILSMMGMSMFDYVSIVNPIGVMELLLSMGGTWKLISSSGIVILLGIIAVVVGERKWKDTEKR